MSPVLFDVALTAFSILAGVFFTLRFRKDSKPYYSVNLMSLGGVEHPEIEIKYSGEIVPNIHSARLIIWNSGSKAIRKSDIPDDGSGPKLVIKGMDRILAVFSEASNETKVVSDVKGSAVHLGFGYLNQHDSIRVEVLFTSEPSAEVETDIAGSVIGANFKRGAYNTYTRTDYVVGALMSTVSLFVAGWAAVTLRNELGVLEEPSFSAIAFLCLLVFSAFFLGCLSLVGFTELYRMPDRTIPKRDAFFLHRPRWPIRK